MSTASLETRFAAAAEAVDLPFSSLQSYWAELVRHYGATNRHYHNLNHLHQLFQLCDEYNAKLEDATIVNWAIWYHDIIYNARRKDNEAQSAQLAKVRLEETTLSSGQVMQIVQFIEATAQHLSVLASGDLAYFLDFDLAILGAPAPEYRAYTDAIRKEYRHVPGFFYRRGRRKVIQYFSQAKQLYRTPELRQRFESQARANLHWELQKLS